MFESPVSPSEDLEYVRQVNGSVWGRTRRGRAAATARTGPAPERPAFDMNRSAARGGQPGRPAVGRRPSGRCVPKRPVPAAADGSRGVPSPGWGVHGRARYLEQVQLATRRRGK